jgi:hypothetical protein
MDMNILHLDRDRTLIYVTAASFPEGVPDAHARLHQLIPFSTDRDYFGLSRPENGGPIVYRAAAEEKEPGEAERYHCRTLILKKGSYVYRKLTDFRKAPGNIGKIFQELLVLQNLDPEGYCVEWYLNSEEAVKCMIRLRD